MAEKIETPQRLYLQIANALAELIKTGEVNVGERFASERELAAKFTVSRSTIREAMIALEVSGVVEIRSGSGIYALAPTTKLKPVAIEDTPGPFEVLEARMIIEVEAASLAAERMSNDELLKLKQLLHAMEYAEEKSDINEAERIDQAFHLQIIESTRNSALLPIYRWLWEIRESSKVSKKFHTMFREKGSVPSIGEHKAVLDALMQRDGQAAALAMKTHLTAVMHRLTEHSLV